MRQKSSVLDFIEKQRANEVSDKQIMHKLLEGGWPADIVIRAMENKPIESVTQEKSPATQRSKIYRFARSW